MSERNAFFATVFSKELERWQKETGKTLSEFSTLIGAHPNNISRYKKGSAFPSPYIMGNICSVLNVDESIFYPSTFEEKFHYDKEFQEKVMFKLFDAEYELVSAAQIDKHFWIHFWEIDGVRDIFPFESRNSDDWIIFKGYNSENEMVGLTKKDLYYMKYLQAEMESHLLLVLLKDSMFGKKNESDSLFDNNTDDESSKK